MKYMLLIYSKENAYTKEEWTECTVESTAICHELAAKGQFLAASPLHPTATAVSVRVRDGKRLITDGPFAETTEQLGGFYLIDVAHLDEAIAIAGKLPPAKKGTVEIRPLLILDNLPPDKLSQIGAFSAANGALYMFLCYDDALAWNQAGEETLKAAMMEAVALTDRLNARGKYISASPLHPTSTATSVRIRDGRRVISDGPFAETREILGGYYLILAKDQGEAIEIASQHPGAYLGAVEIRQVFELTGLPN
jgi:hypothetical protein